jgi:hypothetical protein
LPSPSWSGVPRRERTPDRTRYNWSLHGLYCFCIEPALPRPPDHPPATQEHYDEINRVENTSCGSSGARLGQQDDPQVTTFWASEEQ